MPIIVILVVIQFIRVDSTIPPIDRDIPTSTEVKSVLRRACYDCHSNETTLVQPYCPHLMAPRLGCA
jgi:hypothetical protein